MRNHPFDAPMSANDTHVFPQVDTERRKILELSGVTGGATAAIGYIDPSGNFAAFKASIGGDPITTLAADGWVVEVPSSGLFAVTLTGATGTTALKLKVTEAAP